MFTPALMAMMLHSVWSDLPSARPVLHHKNVHDIAAEILDLIYLYRDASKPVPLIPVTGYARHPGLLAQSATVAPASDAPHARPPALFGRIPVEILARQFAANPQVDVYEEYLDLGTPLTSSQTGPMGPASLAKCGQLLGIRPAGLQSRLLVALIDRGDDAPVSVSPDHFNHRVHHLYPSGVVFSQHAADVFQTLLERLVHHGVVHDIDFVVGLIKKPANPIGRACFQHTNMVELHEAVSRLATYAKGLAMPVVSNISMGTHVGSHRGDTPLEVEISQRLRFVDDRVFVCAAGNDGLASVSAALDLEGGVEEHLRLRTSSAGCTELLIELWWDEAGGGNTMDLTANVRDPQGARVTPAINVNSQNVGASMQKTGAGFKGVFCQSLYQAQCQGPMNCVALALSSSRASDLADLVIDLSLRTLQAARLRAWVVLPNGATCSFVGSRPASNVTVPATFDDAIAVAGMNSGQPWKESSRGDPSMPNKPTLAHLADNLASPQMGTSFAAPRLTADVVERFLRDAVSVQAPFAVASFPTVDDLTRKVLARHGQLHAHWNTRTGYGAIVSKP